MSEALQYQTYKRKMATVYRLVALRVSSGFCTVSDDAVCVITSMQPIDILVAERQRLHRRRTDDPVLKKLHSKQELEESLKQWYER